MNLLDWLDDRLFWLLDTVFNEGEAYRAWRRRVDSIENGTIYWYIPDHATETEYRVD